MRFIRRVFARNKQICRKAWRSAARSELLTVKVDEVTKSVDAYALYIEHDCACGNVKNIFL